MNEYDTNDRRDEGGVGCCGWCFQNYKRAMQKAKVCELSERCHVVVSVVMTFHQPGGTFFFVSPPFFLFCCGA